MLRCEKGNSVLLLPLWILDKTNLNPSRNQSPYGGDQTFAFKSDDGIDFPDPSSGQRVDGVRNQRASENRNQRFQETLVRAAQPRTRPCH